MVHELLIPLLAVVNFAAAQQKQCR